MDKNAMMRTKAMREKEEQRERRKYNYTLLRIRLPDGSLLQGKSERRRRGTFCRAPPVAANGSESVEMTPCRLRDLLRVGPAARAVRVRPGLVGGRLAAL